MCVISTFSRLLLSLTQDVMEIDDGPVDIASGRHTATVGLTSAAGNPNVGSTIVRIYFYHLVLFLVIPSQTADSRPRAAF